MALSLLIAAWRGSRHYAVREIEKKGVGMACVPRIFQRPSLWAL
jgi:hypothetical protein